MRPRYRVRTARPIAKVSVATLAGALTAIIAWAIRTWVNIDIPAEVQAAITTVLMAIAAYLTPLGMDEVEEVRT